MILLLLGRISTTLVFHILTDWSKSLDRNLVTADVNTQLIDCVDQMIIMLNFMCEAALVASWLMSRVTLSSTQICRVHLSAGWQSNSVIRPCYDYPLSDTIFSTIHWTKSIRQNEGTTTQVDTFISCIKILFLFLQARFSQVFSGKPRDKNMQ